MSDFTWNTTRNMPGQRYLYVAICLCSSVERLAELRALYRAQNKIVKRSVKHDKRNCIDALASAAQTAADIGDISAVYKITKEVTNNSTNLTHTVKDIDGHLLLSAEEQMEE